MVHSGQERSRQPRFESISEQTIESLLYGVDKPARYVGGEANSVVKTQPVQARMALCYPDVYEIAESHIGLKILYKIVNADSRFAAERAYAFWPDLEARAKEKGVPLWSLESRLPLSAFEMVGFTLQYELSYTTLLAMLEQGGIALRAAHRQAGDPFVVGGGAGAYNPEPIAPFFDCFLLGDGERAVIEMLEVVADGRARELSREAILVELARLDGMYVPSHYDVEYDEIITQNIVAKSDSPKAATTSKHKTPRVTRTVLPDLDALPFPTKTVVPNVKPVHDRLSIEIQRGCSQSCRFCQAGMITRPTRQRSPEKVLELADASVKDSGYQEVGLLSLSAGDYEPINDVLETFFERYEEDNISISLPSLRTETMTPRLAEQVSRVRKSGFTFAPEAGSERMRKVINKTNTEENLMNAVRATVNAGWRHLKFYFMIGLPTETDEDIDAIAHLGERARLEGRKIRGDINVTVSVSTFVPKPHTSFQWERQISVEETKRKQQRIRERLEKKKINFRYHNPEQSYIEGVLSRGDRRLADALELAMRKGCRLDGWSEWHDRASWMQALHEGLEPWGLSPDDYLQERPAESLLPWDHLDAGILKKFLLRDRKRAYDAANIQDCAFSKQCYACGGCDLGNPYTAKHKDAEGQRLIQLQPIVYEEAPSESTSSRTPNKSYDIGEIPPEERIRVRFQYAKLGRAFHFSHLDVKDHLLRACRQAELPVLYSNGFHRRIRASFSPACPTGVASEAEFFEVECHQNGGLIDEKQFAEGLGRYLPEGLFILDAWTVSEEMPSINEGIRAYAYVAEFGGSMNAEMLRERVRMYRSQNQLMVSIKRKHKIKTVDAKQAVFDVQTVAGKLHFAIHSKSLKPSEAVAAILGGPEDVEVRLRKVRVDFASEIKMDTLAGGLDEHLTGGLDLTQFGQIRRQKVNKPGARNVVPYAE